MSSIFSEQGSAAASTFFDLHVFHSPIQKTHLSNKQRN